MDFDSAAVRLQLQKDTPIHRAEIQALYRQLDRRFGLHGADVPLRFGFDEEVLGSYTPKGGEEKEHFYFSLFFIGYCNEHSLHKEDKIDLYKHEYAHYMQHHYENIPKEYLFRPGKHGSAWQYCCSLIGAAPSPYYRFGQGKEKHDYGKVLANPLADKQYTLKDNMRREKEYRDLRGREVKFKVGDEIEHKMYGKGEIEAIEQKPSSVTLSVNFRAGVKRIDQEWLIRSRMQTQTQRKRQG